MQLPLNGVGSLVTLADIAAHEMESNPDGGNIQSNPFAMAMATDSGFLVIDPAANSLLEVTAAGDVSTLVVLPDQPNPVAVGPTRLPSLPTGISVGPDGAYYISQITDVPYRNLSPNVYRFDPATDELSVAYSGFDRIVDLTFDGDGNMYVLHSSNVLDAALGPGSGALIKIDLETGHRTTIVSTGLTFPTSVLAGADGTLFVTNRGTSATNGQVLRISPAPEPTLLILIVFGFSATFAVHRSRFRA
jgi:hypothetical protein